MVKITGALKIWSLRVVVSPSGTTLTGKEKLVAKMVSTLFYGVRDGSLDTGE